MRTNSMRSTGKVVVRSSKLPRKAQELALDSLVVARTYLWGTGPQISYENAPKSAIMQTAGNDRNFNKETCHLSAPCHGARANCSRGQKDRPGAGKRRSTDKRGMQRMTPIPCGREDTQCDPVSFTHLSLAEHMSLAFASHAIRMELFSFTSLCNLSEIVSETPEMFMGFFRGFSLAPPGVEHPSKNEMDWRVGRPRTMSEAHGRKHFSLRWPTGMKRALLSQSIMADPGLYLYLPRGLYSISD